MTSDTKTRAWNADIFSINAPLHIAPVGFHAADEKLLDADAFAALKERRKQIHKWFEGFEPLTEDMRPGPVFAQSTLDHAVPVPNAPPPVMSATYSAVNAACRALLEQYDLGATEFYPITVLNAARTEPVWPEIYLMHVRNRKASIDIAARVADGTVRRDDVSAEVKMLFDKHRHRATCFLRRALKQDRHLGVLCPGRAGYLVRGQGRGVQPQQSLHL